MSPSLSLPKVLDGTTPFGGGATIKLVEYISCSECFHTLIGKTETQLYIAQFGRIVVFEVTTTWLCLRCRHIQDQRIEIREIWENYPKIKTCKPLIVYITIPKIYAGKRQRRIPLPTLRQLASWKKEDCTYYWINFGVVLIENIANYICKSCKRILIQVVEHKEEKENWKDPEKKLKFAADEDLPYTPRSALPILGNRINREISDVRS